MPRVPDRTTLVNGQSRLELASVSMPDLFRNQILFLQTLPSSDRAIDPFFLLCQGSNDETHFPMPSKGRLPKRQG